MESVGYANNQLVGLRVVRGPNWEWDTQDEGEGFVGTVVENIKNSRRVKVRWDSGQKFIYRIGDEDAYDLRVLDNSTVGVKHPGVECRGCGQKDIAGLRWQCFDCPTPINLCTFCFTNGKHDQQHVNFRRFDHPSSDPIVFLLDPEKRKVQLKGFFHGALVRRGVVWKYWDEDGGSSSFGKVVQVPNGSEMTPGKVWVQWPDKEEPNLYRAGFNGKMDLGIVKAGIGGLYQPDTLPVLVISKPRTNEKTNDVVADPPFVIGDRVKVVVGLKQLREMSVNCELNWMNSEMERLVNEILIIEELKMETLNHDKTVKVVSSKWKNNGIWLPVKALRRSIPWLPVGAAVQVIDQSHSDGMDMAHDGMAGDFGRVKQVNFDGKTVDIEFFTSDGNVTRTVPVSQLQDKFVDVSVIEKVESIRKDLAKLLLSEVEKGSILSVQYLLKTYPDIINCQSRYNGRNSTAISVACQKGNVEMVKLLLTHKASVDIADEEDKEEDCDESDEDEDETNKKGKKPIHHTAVRNYPEVLRLLLQNGSSSIEINGYKRTPLHLAAMKGHVECVRVLLEDEQCDLAIQDSKRKTAFRLAVKSSVQSLELFNLFLATGKWNNTFAERWFLHFATENNNFGAMKVLLSCPEGKKLIRGCDGLDRTPLFIACKNGHNQIAKLLVSNVDKDENGKPWGIDTPNKEKETPLMRVVKKFNYELIEILIGSGANLQATNDDGHTPFHYAASLYKEKKRHPNWPNQETAPAIFKLYNELKIKHPSKILCPVAAIICYLVINGGIPQNLPLPEIKNLIGDDFLYGEIIKILPFPNSMAQNSDSQGSHPIETNEINREQSIKVGDKPAKTSALQRDRQSSKPKSYSRVESGNEPVTVMTSLQDPLPSQSVVAGVATGESATGPIAQRQQQRNFRSFSTINENVPGTVTPTGNAAANTNDDDYLEIEVSDSETTDMLIMGETNNNNREPINDQPTAGSSIDNPVPGNSRTFKVVRCTIEKKLKKKEDGLAEDNISWIIIDENGRRYSQQKVFGIFQCTANVASLNKSNYKKCRGTIFVKDLNVILGEWEKDKEKKFTFEVRNLHEEHLISKRKPSEIESDTPSTSSKRKKKTSY